MTFRDIDLNLTQEHRSLRDMLRRLGAVSDRDFAIEFAAFAAITMVHVSCLAE